MAVQVWIGEKPEHPNERKAIIALANGLDRLEGLYLMLANFSVGGNTIDLVVVKHDAIFIIELKHCDGRVFGAVNGQWKVISDSGYSKILNPGRKNPYNQVIAYYYSFINFLNANRLAFMSEQKAGTIDFRACRRVVVIAPMLQPGSQIDVDWKVTCRGLDELPTYLVTERTSEINLTESEMLAIPSLLNCVPWQEVNDLVAGVMPSWEETPSDIALPAALEDELEPEELELELPPAGPFQRSLGWLRARPLITPLLLIAAVVVLVLLFTRSSQPPAAPSIQAAPLPTAWLGVGELQPINGCIYPIQQPVRKRKDPGSNSWVTVDISAAREQELPDVVVTLEQVEFCEGQVVLRWSVQNWGNQPIRMPLTNDNISIIDTTALTYQVDERASEPQEIYARSGETRRGSAVIARPINPNANTFIVRLTSAPFPAVWPVAVPREVFSSWMR